MDIDLGGDQVTAPAAMPEQVSVHPLEVIRPRGEQLSVARPSRLAGKHIAVVGVNYAPEVTGIAPYTTEMSQFLASRAGEAGLVSVLTGLPHYPEWRVADGYAQKRRTSSLRHEPASAQGGRLDLIRHRHFVPAQMSAVQRARFEASFWGQASLTRLATRPDVVVAVTPSLSGALVGAQLARRSHCPLVVVVQDLMARAASQSGISGGKAVAGVTAMMEGRALGAADRVITVSRSFHRALREYGIAEQNIDLVPNWCRVVASPLDVAAAKKVLGWDPNRFAVVHTGNMGFKQGLETVIRAARELERRAEPVDIVMVGDGNQRRMLERLGQGLSNLRFVDPVAEDQYPVVLAASDLLLVCERGTVADMSLPSKLTSYLTAGRPLVASVAPEGATAAELRKTGGAAQLVPADNGWGLADAITVLMRAEETRNQMSQVAVEYANANLAATASLNQIEAVIEKVLAGHA